MNAYAIVISHPRLLWLRKLAVRAASHARGAVCWATHNEEIQYGESSRSLLQHVWPCRDHGASGG